MTANVISTSKAGTFGTSVAAARPADVQAGDVLFAVHHTTTSYASIANPTGWGTPIAVIDDVVFGAMWTRVYRRTVTGSEPASYTFPQASGTGVVIISAVDGADLGKTARIAVFDTVESSSAIVTPTVTPAAGTHLELRFGAVALGLTGSATLGSPAGYTPRSALNQPGAISAALASRLLTSSTPSGEKSFTVTGTNRGITHGITISVPSGVSEPTEPTPPPFTPGQGSALYQYVFRRLLSRAYLGHLDLSGVSFDKRASTAGSFNAQVPITSVGIGDQIDEIIPRDRSELTRGPGVIAVEILREGEYWGEYWVHGATISKQRRQAPVLNLRGSTLDSYFQHVLLRETIAEFTDDQIEHARQLLTAMQAQTQAGLGLILQSGTSGTSRTQGYAADKQAYYGRLIGELADRLGGFEWTINTVAGPAGLERHWVWGAPTLGNPAAEHVFGGGPSGGDILDWRYEIDALKGGTHWQARGDSVDTDASTSSVPLLSSVHESTSHLTAGWPRIDRVVDRAGVTSLPTLEDFAAGWAAQKSGAVTVFSVTVAIGQDPSFTPNNLGDPARFVMTDEWHKRQGTGPGRNSRHRVIGVGVTPVGRDKGKDEMQLIIEETAVT